MAEILTSELIKIYPQFPKSSKQETNIAKRFQAWFQYRS